ncbi:MAG: hypothetical protein AABX01_02850 [Candidatus Micrarchaeota archaeon]
MKFSRLFLFAPILIISILLFGCTSAPEPSGNYTNQSGYAQSKVISVTDCNKLYNFSVAKDECLLNSSIYGKDPLGCMKIFNSTFKDDCFSHVANLTGRISLCDNVTQAKIRNLCIRSFPEGRTVLYDCLKLPEAQRDGCYFSIAIEGKNPDICMKIKNKNQTDACLSKIGISSKNLAICDRVIDRPLRYECAYYNAIIANDSDACGKLNSKMGDECLFRIATARQSENLCAEIGDAGMGNECFEKLAQSKGASGICERISGNASLRDGCYYYFMQKERIISYCYKIASIEKRGDCYSFMAQKNNNMSICFLINSTSIAVDRCIYDYGVSNNNYSSCINIEDLNLKRSCLAIVGG